jgi:hypothetical protein
MEIFSAAFESSWNLWIMILPREELNFGCNFLGDE